MVKFILILLVVTSDESGPVRVDEYKTQEGCFRAGEALMQSSLHKASPALGTRRVEYVCLKKEASE